MKLILCLSCKDVVALSRRDRACDCGRSGGHYNEGGETITIGGPCQVYGVDNRVFTAGRADAFVYPEDNGKVTRQKRGRVR